MTDNPGRLFLYMIPACHMGVLEPFVRSIMHVKSYQLGAFCFELASSRYIAKTLLRKVGIVRRMTGVEGRVLGRGGGASRALARRGQAAARPCAAPAPCCTRAAKGSPCLAMLLRNAR